MSKLLTAIGSRLCDKWSLVIPNGTQQAAQRATGVLATNYRAFDRSTHSAQMSTSTTATEPEVVALTRQNIGVAKMNRPRALNALNNSMVETLLQQYQQWISDPVIHAVILKGAGEKAFCAGGDVKTMAELIQTGQKKQAQRFFQTEYKLNYLIGSMPIPHIAFMDGIVMGGGAGVSIHGAFRIATERTVFAMPECGIGLFPDVGGSHFLTRLPGELGTYLALTGTRLKGVQVLEAQLATHYIPSALLPELEEAIVALGPAASDKRRLAQLLGDFQTRTPVPQPSGLLQELNRMADTFVSSRLEDIYAALRRQPDEFCHNALSAMSRGSPLSQKITLEQLRRGRWLDLAACLEMEYHLVSHICFGPSDFLEGVAATLVRKTGDPKWNPSSVEQVSQEMVDKFFTPYDDNRDALELSTLQSRL